jgi:hypothetical protein
VLVSKDRRTINITDTAFMPQIIAILLEDTLEDSYVAIRLDGTEPEILFTKGPSFTKTMGPFPEAYAEATFKKWNYRKVINPPEVKINSPESLRTALLRMRTCGNLVRYEDA